MINELKESYSKNTLGSKSMEFSEFVRKPFVVEALEITEENISEVAKFVGTICKNEDESTYIQVDRRLIPNVDRVYPGFWMTKMGKNFRCYSSRIFTQQFTSITPEIKSWIDFMNQKDTPTEEVKAVEVEED